MIRKKIRRLTIRVGGRGKASGREQEFGVTTIVATPAAAAATRQERAARRREIVVGPADGSAPSVTAAGGPATPIERLVAEAHERVLLLSRKSGRGVAQEQVLGRLAATGEISRRQHEAGARYAVIVREHDLLLGRSVSPSAATGEPGGDDQREEVSDRARYRAAMARFDCCRAALRDAGREDRMAAAVVDAVAVNNWELPELTPALRIGLNHLARTLDAMAGPEGPGARPGWPG